MNLEEIKTKLKNRKVGVIGDRKEFAILIPLVETNEGLSLLYEVRGKTIKQPGDVCFPGGKIEKGEDVFSAALRETEEELGIKSSDIEILGRFDSLLEVNRLRLHTVVGLVNNEAVSNIKLNYEVSEYFTVPIKFLEENKPDYFKQEIIQDITGFPFDNHGIDPNYKWRKAFQDTFFWHYEGHCIWGITSAITEWFINHL